MRLVNALVDPPHYFSSDSLELFSDYFPLIHNYRTMALNDSNQLIFDLDIGPVKVKQKLCRKLMTDHVSVVKVRLESNKYMRTIKDRRLSFADKLAAFGEEDSNSQYI